MSTARRRQPISFTRGRRLYEMAHAHTGEGDYIGIYDGRLGARAPEAEAAARALIVATPNA